MARQREQALGRRQRRLEAHAERTIGAAVRAKRRRNRVLERALRFQGSVKAIDRSSGSRGEWANVHLFLVERQSGFSF
jgi:muconolactone delta-isomerase